jgi:hypothetical protein
MSAWAGHTCLFWAGPAGDFADSSRNIQRHSLRQVESGLVTYQSRV